MRCKHAKMTDVRSVVSAQLCLSHAWSCLVGVFWFARGLFGYSCGQAAVITCSKEKGLRVLVGASSAMPIDKWPVEKYDGNFAGAPCKRWAMSWARCTSACFSWVSASVSLFNQCCIFTSTDDVLGAFPLSASSSWCRGKLQLVIVLKPLLKQPWLTAWWCCFQAPFETHVCPCTRHHQLEDGPACRIRGARCVIPRAGCRYDSFRTA